MRLFCIFQFDTPLVAALHRNWAQSSLILFPFPSCSISLWIIFQVPLDPLKNKELSRLGAAVSNMWKMSKERSLPYRFSHRTWSISRKLAQHRSPNMQYLKQKHFNSKLACNARMMLLQTSSAVQGRSTSVYLIITAVNPFKKGLDNCFKEPNWTLLVLNVLNIDLDNILSIYMCILIFFFNNEIFMVFCYIIVCWL